MVQRDPSTKAHYPGDKRRAPKSVHWSRDDATHEAVIPEGSAHTKRLQYQVDALYVRVRRGNRSGRFGSWESTLISVDYFDRLVQSGAVVSLTKAKESEK